MLWTIDGTPHRILGSIHVLPRDVEMPEWVSRAHDGVGRIVLEADATATDKFLEVGIDRSGAHLNFPGSRALYQQAAEILAAAGTAIPFDGMRPWRAALFVAFRLQSAALGISPEKGVEHALRQIVAQRELRIAFLEEPSRAFDIFDSTVEADGGTALMERLVRDPGLAERELVRTITAWLRSDLTDLAAIQAERISQFPRVFEPLFNGRNLEWLPKVMDMVRDETPTLFAVGAIHTVGPASLLAHLQRNGIPCTLQTSNG
ncbi:TraB/GumN family protein [Luteolibacter arcticus]|uniref:TraB/GumN family protein n=1 Tax=Luteolibacter arcticus TaxID=1581411 RepID=A0ABT3GH77_9BACT|nr:TraB/GumN family protein [Luteolibacter arcticus]MCW1922670.1 TraB/GumN family protein [Luteolibacter arcticus]